MDYKTEYQSKLITADAAAAMVKSGDWVDYGWAVNTTVAVDAALAKRLPQLENVNFRGGILMWTPAIFQIEDPAAHMTWNSWHMGGIERKAVAQGFSFYAPIRYSELPRYYRESNDPVNVAVFQVAPMDEHGYKAGKINGSRKQIDKGRQVYAFGAGTQKMYDYLNDNPECMSAPVDYTNDIRTISALDNFISINNAVDVDLFGQINAESAGIKNISGAGGQLDFVLGAYLSNGGKSFICLSSTFNNRKTGKVESRICPTLANGSIVTDTRANIHYLCTEYGCVNLKGMTTWEKAEAIINLAHPDFREELIAEAAKMHIWRRSNKR